MNQVVQAGMKKSFEKMRTRLTSRRAHLPGPSVPVSSVVLAKASRMRGPIGTPQTAGIIQGPHRNTFIIPALDML
jgi:hypothetical protein